MQRNLLMVSCKYMKGENNLWLTNEIALKFKENGWQVKVIAISYYPDDPESSVGNEGGIQVFRYKFPKFMYTRLFKPLRYLLTPFVIKRIVKKQIKNEKVDLSVMHTGCFMFYGLPQYFKKRFSSYTYLFLWDFYPYCLHYLNKNITNVMRHFKHKFYSNFNMIGCMTKGSIDFLRKNYDYKKDNIELLPLWAETKPMEIVNKDEIRNQYGFNQEDIIVVYGGTITFCQDLTRMLDVALLYQDDENRKNDNVKFVIIGKGKEKYSLIERAKSLGLNNLRFMDYIPRTDYEKFLQTCDIGMIMLSSDMQVPNFPSKTVDYCKLGLPIVAFIDKITDFGFILEKEMQSGVAVANNNIVDFYNKINSLVSNKEERERFGRNGRKYYETVLSSQKAFETITGNFYKD